MVGIFNKVTPGSRTPRVICMERGDNLLPLRVVHTETKKHHQPIMNKTPDKETTTGNAGSLRVPIAEAKIEGLLPLNPV